LLKPTNSPALRRLIVALVGAAFFLLGSAYLSLDRPHDVVVLKVVGGKSLRAGLPASFRVVANWVDEKKGVEVKVEDVRVGGVSALNHSSPGTPALAQAAVLAGVEDPAPIAFDVEVAGRKESLHITMPVRRMAPEPALPTAPPKLQATQRAHRVSVLAEAGVLASGLVNQVFIRVRDLQGVPLDKARVTVSHPSLPDGSISAYTEGSGLMSFEVDAKRPSFRFKIKVEHGGAQSELEELLIPVGRQMLLRMDKAVFAPERPITAKLRTWRADAEVFCDLVQGDVLLWSHRGTSAAHGLTLKLGAWPEGRYSLQCSDHPWAMGEAYASAAVLVSEQDALSALLTELRDQQYLHPSGLVAPTGTKEHIASAYWQAILRNDPMEQTILMSTRESDIQSRDEAHESKKSFLLTAIALVFLLVLGWMVEVILKNIIDRRDRLRAYAAESFMDEVNVDVDGFTAGDQAKRATIMKTRGILAVVVFFGAIIGNVVGIIWLFVLIR